MSRYIFFLHIEATHVGGVASMVMKLYYRVIGQDTLELMMKYILEEFDEVTMIIGRFRLHEPMCRNVLMHHTREYFSEGRNYLGLGYIFYKSPVMSEREFRTIIDDIVSDLKINRYLQEKKRSGSALYTLCKEHGFEVIPTPDHNDIAECRCPTGYSHRFTINLENDTWGCGWCKKKGGLKELREHFEKYMNK